jgi:predicted ATPase/transcriptional regulator with XRE-family HTH domain
MSAVQNPESFGEWVKSRRRRLDLTQAELGKRAGCSAAAIRKFEADERKPSRDLAMSLSRALEIPETDRDTFLQMARGIFIDKALAMPSGSRSAIANNLPALLTSSIDRTHDLMAVASLIRDKNVRLVTLIGPPGIGKTRLSVQCGTDLLPDFPDGVWFVDLADMENAVFFPATVSRFLEFLEMPPSPGLSQLIAGIKDRKLLLILDNFEHIVDQAAVDVAQILKNCRDLKILVTSRVPLHITGEHEYPLPSLSIPPRGAEKDPDSLLDFESVQLLVARTRQHQPKFSITADNARSVSEICTILEGIPLALELASASLRRMTLDEMVSLLKGFRGVNWVRQIGTPARDLPGRQRTLENVVAWSYTLLTGAQQDLFCKLGLFSGWFDSEAAASICFDDPGPSLAGTHDMLGELSDRSLLVRDFVDGIPCWRMLELIHEYASLKMDSDVRSGLRLRFTHHFLENLKTVNRLPDREQQDAFYHLNVSNLHAALKWAIAEKDTELGFQLALNLDDLWMSHGYSKEGLELLTMLFALPDSSTTETRIGRLQSAADLAWQKHDFETSLVFSRESAELAKVHGLQAPYVWYLNRQGRIFIEQGHYDQARQALEECYNLALSNPEAINPGTPMAQLGELALFEGRLDDARWALEKTIEYLIETQDTNDLFLNMAKTDLAETALAQKDFPQALHWLGQVQEYTGPLLRRFLVYLCAVAGYFILSPGRHRKDWGTAAQIYGAIESLSERSGIILGAFYQKNISERIALARKHVSAREWEKAFQDGQHLSRDEVIALAKRELEKSQSIMND